MFSEEEADLVGAMSQGEALFGRDAVLQLARVFGSGIARIADALVSAFMVNVAPKAEAEGMLALAQANAQAADLMPLASRWMDALLRRHVELARRPLLPPAGASARYETQVLAVGFADIVGSTALAQQLSTADLGAAIGAFESEAMDRALEHGGRLVKFIGDEAMFVVADPAAACEVGLELVEFVDAHPLLPGVRVGLALGEVLNREGDYYGPVVNLAARAVNVAEPGGVVVSNELRAETVDSGRNEARSPGYSFNDLGGQELRGFDEPVQLYALKRS